MNRTVTHGLWEVWILILAKFLFKFLIFVVLGFEAQAQVNFFAGTKILVAIPQYSGLTGVSLGETGTGFAGELQLETDGYWLVSFVKARATYITGAQIFLDGATTVNASFNYLQGGLDLGFHLYPIRRRKSGFNIYLGGSGGMAYNSIQLDGSAVTTSIPKTDQSVGTGYAGILGVEFGFGGASKKKWTLISELSHRTESAKLLNQSNFDLRNVTIGVGVGW